MDMYDVVCCTVASSRARINRIVKSCRMVSGWGGLSPHFIPGVHVSLTLIPVRVTAVPLHIIVVRAGL